MIEERQQNLQLFLYSPGIVAGLVIVLVYYIFT